MKNIVIYNAMYEKWALWLLNIDLFTEIFYIFWEQSHGPLPFHFNYWDATLSFPMSSHDSAKQI